MWKMYFTFMFFFGKCILHLLYDSENIGKNTLQKATAMENLTQTERVAQMLKEIAPDINAQNRKELKEKTNLSMPTISKYLSGKIADVETGVGILQFCRAIIMKREQRIAS